MAAEEDSFTKLLHSWRAVDFAHASGAELGGDFVGAEFCA